MLQFFKLVTHQNKNKGKTVCHGLSLCMLTSIIPVRIYCAGNFVFLKRLTISSLKDVLLRISVLQLLVRDWFFNVIFFALGSYICDFLITLCDAWSFFCPGLISNERQFMILALMAFTIDRFIILFAKVTNRNNSIEWRTVTLLNGNWSYSHILG